MAILGSNFLSGCSSIPDFIATGSRMVFEQTDAPGHNPPAAPTSWTKETNIAFNDVALRVVTGAASTSGPPGPPGGGLPFSRPAPEGLSVFPSNPRGLSGVPLAGPSQLSVNPSGSILTLGPNPSNVNQGASSPHAMDVPEMRNHIHTFQRRGNSTAGRGSAATQNTPLLPTSTFTTANFGQGGSHNHSISDNGHSHQIGTGNHNHTVQEASHTHQGGFQMTARDFRLLYMDVIICTKN